MEPSSSSITAAVSLEHRGVRFDNECVLIPDPQPRSRMPKLFSKSSSFIFKKKLPQDLPSLTPPPRDHDVLQSPTSPRPALSRKGKPPVPVQRRSSLPPPSRKDYARTPSLPSTPLVTIPLRPCCPNCFSATELPAVQGDTWTESFSRAAHRRRSASMDNRPCPPHILPDSGATAVKWSSVAASPPTSFRSVVIVDEADGEAAGLSDDVASTLDEKGLNEARKRLDDPSVQDPEECFLPPLLSRHKPWLSPIPSNNPSVDDISPACPVTEDADCLPTSCSPTSALVSRSPSPLPRTPSSSAFSSPVSSPKISSPSQQSERDSSPRVPGSFRIPKGVSLMRTGSEILKGVSVLGGAPI